MVIDHELKTIFTNDSIPINLGWEYRLMGKGDDYIEVYSILGKTLVLRGIGDTKMDQKVLASSFDGVVKEVVNSGVYGLCTEDLVFLLGEEGGDSLLWK